VFVSNSKFTYNAGTFTGNTAEDYGAAVYKNSSAMINGDGGVEAGGSDIPYDVFPPES
jgi:hypothetical protein